MKSRDYLPYRPCAVARLWGPLALGGTIVAANLFWSYSAAGLTLTLLGQGTLPSGDVIETSQLTLRPGDTVPWHYHTGPGWGTIVSGTLTEDEGCGSTLNVYSAGAAFSETPGRVHRVFNLGAEPVVMIWVEIVPSCHVPTDTVFVTGPKCLGNSGKSQLEKIAPCEGDEKSDAATSHPESAKQGEPLHDGAASPNQSDAK